jgi:hypothetical protein
MDHMDVQLVDALPYDPAARAVWVHELRNALNRIGLHSALAQRLLEKGSSGDAASELVECRRAWEESCALLAVASSAVQLGATPGERPATCDVTH